MYCVDINKYTSLLPGCAMLIGYSLLLRPGEIGYQPRSDEKNLYNKSITWHPNFDNPQEISMKVDASKHETEIIYAHCKGDKSRHVIQCPVYLLKHWINMKSISKIKFKSNDFVFILWKLFRYDHLNNWLKNEYKNRSLQLYSTYIKTRRLYRYGKTWCSIMAH